MSIEQLADQAVAQFEEITTIRRARVKSAVELVQIYSLPEPYRVTFPQNGENDLIELTWYFETKNDTKDNSTVQYTANCQIGFKNSGSETTFKHADIRNDKRSFMVQIDGGNGTKSLRMLSSMYQILSNSDPKKSTSKEEPEMISAEKVLEL